MGRFDDIDLTKVASISPLPDGVYIVRIEEWEEKPTKTGNQKIVWKTALVKPEEVIEKVSAFYFDTPLSEAALWRLKNLAKAAGTLREGPFDPEDLIGKEVGLVIQLESTAEYGTRSNVTAFVAAHQANPKMTGTWEDVDAAEEAQAPSGEAAEASPLGG